MPNSESNPLRRCRPTPLNPLPALN